VLPSETIVMESLSEHPRTSSDLAVRRLLRTEGAAAATVVILLYGRAGHSWLMFALLFLVPDLSMLGYLAGARAGALVYNVVHTYTGPLALAAVLLLTGGPLVIPFVWLAHIGLDRALGYGLKYPTAFQDTHLGRIGRPR